MLHLIFSDIPEMAVPVIAGAAGFLLTFILTGCLMDRLPRDGGKEFAVGGEASRGKATGGGVIFVSVFIGLTFLLIPLSIELSIYMGILFLEMLFGFLDDRAKAPWGRLKKGLLDLLSAAGGAGTFLYFHREMSGFFMGKHFVELPVPVYFGMAVLLILVAINVTNCSDGVDGLSGSLFIAAVIPFFLLKQRPEKDFGGSVLILLAAILAYLWFNTHPSTVLMGDAGSRVMGYVIALTAMTSGHPLLYLSFSLILILDGGSSLFKITMIHLTGKKDFMKNIRTPLHDHARKNKGWAIPQVPQRFLILQILVSALTLGIYTLL